MSRRLRQADVVGGFEIEGNLVDDTIPDPPIDWFDFDPGDAGFNTGVDNTTATGQDDTTFAGSSKEYVDAGDPGGWPEWSFGTGNATGKSDFGRWATYDFVDDDDHVWFFLGFDRKAGEGTAKYVFELNQVTQDPNTDPNPVRSQGDIRLVVWDQGNGLVTLTGDEQNEDVGLYRWVDPDSGRRRDRGGHRPGRRMGQDRRPGDLRGRVEHRRRPDRGADLVDQRQRRPASSSTRTSSSSSGST